MVFVKIELMIFENLERVINKVLLKFVIMFLVQHNNDQNSELKKHETDFMVFVNLKIDFVMFEN